MGGVVDRPRLNLLLAEHLFRWRRTYSEFGELWTDQQGRIAARCDETDYLTWAGMGLVLEEMDRRGYSLLFSGWSSDAEVAFSQNRAKCRHERYMDGQARGALPEAAGLAALRAVAPEVAEELEKAE